jgi:hypothetical protein
MILGQSVFAAFFAAVVFPSMSVLALRQGLQLLWIHTAPTATEMINRHTLRN